MSWVSAEADGWERFKCRETHTRYMNTSEGNWCHLTADDYGDWVAVLDPDLVEKLDDARAELIDDGPDYRVDKIEGKIFANVGDDFDDFDLRSGVTHEKLFRFFEALNYPDPYVIATQALNGAVS